MFVMCAVPIVRLATIVVCVCAVIALGVPLVPR